jgi:uncharacterized repeat protein (TIGR03803 family)
MTAVRGSGTVLSRANEFKGDLSRTVQTREQEVASKRPLDLSAQLRYSPLRDHPLNRGGHLEVTSVAKAVAFRTAFKTFALVVIGISLTVSLSSASTFEILHKFTGADGQNPFAGPTLDRFGNLYGTTAFGGNKYCACGIIFKIGPLGKYLILYKFNGPNFPQVVNSQLVIDASGALYGTSLAGGPTGSGEIFKFSAGTETVFSYPPQSPILSNGFDPVGVTLDPAGNVYGATKDGGIQTTPCSVGCGVIFKVDPTGQYDVLYKFTGGVDGFEPSAGPILDVAGNLYGTARLGGNLTCDPNLRGCGTVYRVDANGTLDVLKTFNVNDGSYPTGRLVMDKAGNLYGTTTAGGSSTNCSAGCGVIFRLMPNPDGTWSYSVLHAFDNQPAAAPAGSLVFDKYGTLWGTSGGAVGGTVFKMAQRPDGTWDFSVVHKFTGAPSLKPTGDLAIDQAGHVYGTTQQCGTVTTCEGVVFKITP